MNVEEPTRRSNDLYRQQYTSDVVDHWDDYIDWERRRETEGGFFADLLRKHGVRRVLDIACGTGFHTVCLAHEGFDVTGADGSPAMVEKARENAARAGVGHVPIMQADWTRLTDAFEPEGFDAVICLGNSFTHLFEEELRLRALKEIHSVVQRPGIAVIDQRNYDAMLDRDEEHGHSLYYLGESVDVSQELSEDELQFKFEYQDGGSSELTISPIRQTYLTDLLRETGFREVERYGDFERDYRFYDPEFVIQVAHK